MSLLNDFFNIKKMFDGVNEGPMAATPATEPKTKPTTKPGAPRPKIRPRSPVLPHPGVSPKPKAENPDVDLFLKKRGLK